MVQVSLPGHQATSMGLKPLRLSVSAARDEVKVVSLAPDRAGWLCRCGPAYLRQVCELLFGLVLNACEWLKKQRRLGLLEKGLGRLLCGFCHHYLSGRACRAVCSALALSSGKTRPPSAPPPHSDSRLASNPQSATGKRSSHGTQLSSHHPSGLSCHVPKPNALANTTSSGCCASRWYVQDWNQLSCQLISTKETMIREGRSGFFLPIHMRTTEGLLPAPGF